MGGLTLGQLHTRVTLMLMREGASPDLRVMVEDPAMREDWAVQAIRVERGVALVDCFGPPAEPIANDVAEALLLGGGGS